MKLKSGGAMGEIHDLLEEKGKLAVRQLVEGRRGGRLVETAAAYSSDEALGVGFAYSGWCQTGLPHRRLADDSEIWQLQTDSMSLLVEPGAIIDDEGKTKHVGVPYGALARLILIYLQSEALRTGSRDVDLGGSLRGFLKRLDLAPGGRTNGAVREQAERISRCRLSFHAKRHGAKLIVNQNIVDIAMFVDKSDSRQARLFNDTARLGEAFFNELKQHAVPLDEAAIRHIKNSSMSLDIYCWLAYRLHSLTQERLITWPALNGQFGSGVKLLKHFKAQFNENLKMAMAVYPDANIEVSPVGVLLKPSAPPVRKTFRKQTSIE